ncbi:hypothetical protein IEN85_10585 [Pelagicoccus sp. NFK12]|uniref:Uncharacterized protein n=1 Tax=Pelagicoccus enzymogenes TaxID=2773457 RepID=A0A927F8N9_9BACT|nr:hypothetical protein [Pelagicoccus enzymogenes]MBD5779935.1 hypothetical protein [Pelagicoccus enzymogenes]
MKIKELLLLIATFCIVPSLQVTPALVTMFAIDSFALVTILLGIYSFASGFLTMIVAVAVTKERTKKKLLYLFGCTIGSWIAIYIIVDWIRNWGTVAESVWFLSAIIGSSIVLAHNFKEINKPNQAVQATSASARRLT